MAHIQISEEQWKNLNKMKEPSETFSDVLNRIMDYGEQKSILKEDKKKK